MTGNRVLIVEDDAIIGWHLERSLRDLGYQVMGVVDTGERAMAAVAQDAPDLALMDVGLKGALDGIETARQIHLIQDVPVIFLTAYTDLMTLDRAKDAAPYGYLRKPFDDQSLRATIEMALHKHRLEQRLRQSELRYHLLFEAMAEGFAVFQSVLDAEGKAFDFRFLDVNPSFEALTGLTSGQVAGAGLFETLPDLGPEWLLGCGWVAETSRSTVFETYIAAIDKYFRVAVFSPRPGTIAILMSDISAAKKLENSLRASEKRLRTLTSASSSYLLELDCKGIIQFMNKPFPGLRMDELIESHLLKWYPASLRPLLQSSLDTAFTGVTGSPLEFTVPGQIGESRSYIAQIIPVTNDARPKTAVMTITDITEQERAELALAEERAQLARRVEERTADLSVANAQLARAARIKDEFLASMSHELRTPLTGVLGLTEALRKNIYGEISERQSTALANIEESGLHLLNLINDILDLSKIEAGRLELEIRPVSIPAVCKSSMRFVQQAADKKRLVIELQIEPAAETMMADERRLKQILVNLLSNAVKFTPEHGRIVVDIRLDLLRKAIQFTVSDTGIGIEKAQIERLFKPFVQLEAGLARHYSGTGLGLSLVMKLVELYGGGVYVQSEPGKGSQFTVILPWKPASGAALTDWALAHRADQAALEKKLPVALVIEDTRATVDQLPRHLREQGVEVRVWQPEEDALELAAELKPDLIFMDVLLPRHPGWELLQQLKTDARTSGMPVVIVSVLDERMRGIGMGAFEYLVKPFTPQQIAEVVRKILIGRGKRGLTSQPVMGLKSRLVLIAEDNDLTLNTITDYLISLGSQVIAARSGTECVELARECSPDVILMDIQMPGMDGIEAIRRIRASDNGGVVPIIALTALAMVGDRERCIEAGASDYLSKPVSFDTLAETVLHVLQRA